MAGINETAGRSIDKFAVGPDHFEQRLELRMHEARANEVDRLGDLRVQGGISDDFAHTRRRVDENHCDGMPLRLHGRQVFRFEHAGRREEALHTFEKVERAAGIAFVSRGFGILGHGDDGETL